MGLKARILKVTQPDCGGPRNKNVLKSLARTPLQVEQFDKLFASMLASGELKKYSDRRQAIYGPPGLRRRRGSFIEASDGKCARACGALECSAFGCRKGKAN